MKEKAENTRKEREAKAKAETETVERARAWAKALLCKTYSVVIILVSLIFKLRQIDSNTVLMIFI